MIIKIIINYKIWFRYLPKRSLKICSSDIINVNQSETSQIIFEAQLDRPTTNQSKETCDITLSDRKHIYLINKSFKSFVLLDKIYRPVGLILLR